MFAKKSPDSSSQLPRLMESLADVVSKAKFCLVMDDVWNDNENENRNENRWEEVLTPLKRGKPGSKLIITTRSRDVVRAIATCYKGGVEPAVILEGLGDEDMWRILEDHAFGEDKTELTGSLEEIGKEIVKKIQGLPLAAKAIGRVLGNQYSETHWGKIRDSKLWDEMKSGNDQSLIPALILSFLYLPPKAKPCFTYLSLFPKGEEIDEIQLVYQWLAHGYLLDKDGKDMEDVRQEILNVFQNTSLATRHREDWHRDAYIQIHDLIHDMSTASGRDDHLLVMDATKLDENLAEESIRHLAVYDAEHLSKETAGKVGKCKMLRTLRFGNIRNKEYKMEASILCTWFKQLDRLRVLVLRNIDLTEGLPQEIGELKHLRYLGLSHCRILRLPNALAKLRHLQALILGQVSGLRYLDLSNTYMTALTESITALSNLRVLSLQGCYDLKKLPDGIDNLKRLECLDLRGCLRIRKLPPGWRSLSQLRELYTDISEWDAQEIDGTPNLNVPTYTLTITNLDALKPKAKAQIARMVQKNTRLSNLRLEWNPTNGNDTRDAENKQEVLECLKPNINLEKLAIYNCTSTKLPSWLTTPYLRRLELLELSGLQISHSYATSPYNVDEPLFPFLRHLSISNCPNLPLSLEPFLPCLRRLTIRNSPRLPNFPNLPPSLEIMELREVGLSKLPSLQCSDTTSSSWSSPSLHSVTIENCHLLLSLSGGVLESQLPYLSSLIIINCESLVHFPRNGFRDLIYLRSVYLKNCPKLTKLSMESDVGFPASLCYLEIINCESLETESLRNCLQTLPPLQKLTLQNCCSHLSIPFVEAAMAALLRIRIYTGEISFLDHRLHIKLRDRKLIINCAESLQHILEYLCRRLSQYNIMELLISDPGDNIFVNGHLTKLFYELINSTKRLERIQIGEFLHTPNSFYIEDCITIESLSDGIFSYPWPHVRKLQISNCVNLNIPAESGFATTFPALERLTLKSCPMLTNLSLENCHALPASLQELHILDCNSLEVDSILMSLQTPFTSFNKLVLNNTCHLSKSLSKGVVTLFTPEKPYWKCILHSPEFYFQASCYYRDGCKQTEIYVVEQEIREDTVCKFIERLNLEDSGDNCICRDSLVEILNMMSSYNISQVIFKGVREGPLKEVLVSLRSRVHSSPGI